MVGAAPVLAQSQAPIPASLQAEDMKQFGRLVLDFPGRAAVPTYKIQADNGVLTMEFTDSLQVVLPDIAGQLNAYVSVARIDPDGRGIRLGLRAPYKINVMEAGEKLFVDLLPEGWTGVMPGLPNDVVQELSRRAREAALDAERKHKAELVAVDKPHVTLSVGRHPTFIRLQFEWNIDTQAKYTFEAPDGRLQFALPVPIDLYAIQADMPPELVDVQNHISVDGSEIVITAAKGVVPRYYENTPREFVVDIDVKGAKQGTVDLASLLPESAKPAAVMNASAPAEEAASSKTSDQVSVQPTVETVGKTVRVIFPFEAETAAAVFRRGDVLWMLFDTKTKILSPKEGSGLDAIANGFKVVSTGGTQIVHLNLSTDGLATLGSEGRSWVLSVGDVLLSAGEPIKLERVQDSSGAFSITADLGHPGKVHQLRDPDVGDVLDVVTAYPPSRSMLRTLDYVDFTALKSVQGLVIKPNHDDVAVTVAANLTTIGADNGLIVSPSQSAQAHDAQTAARSRDGFIDLVSYVELNPDHLHMRLEQLQQRAASSDRRLLDPARLELARFYLANDLSYEAIGVADFMATDLANKDLAPEVRLLRAAASAVAGRSQDALTDLNRSDMSGKADALMWRTIARADSLDFTGARLDALAAENVADAYPNWVRTKFLMAGARAGLETGDTELAARMLGKIDTATLNKEDLTWLELYSAQLDEANNRFDEALDTFGLVIAAGVRPTHAAAVYETLKLLDRMGRLDPTRAAETLISETLVWRGDEIEAKMQTLLAQLQFRAQDFRGAFQTVRAAAEAHPKDASVAGLLDEARQVFADLYLNGQADSLAPVDALTLYYDYREFTPPGARGDEMVRNLARRLIKVDLLSQAAELLDYQINNRLDGAAKAQIAADLAIVDIADRQPQKALAALNVSRISGLPPALERQRRVLEARALIDSGRDDLALDLLSSMDGRDADLLRVDAHWGSKRYGDAAALIERLYSTLQPDDPLSPSARNNLVRSAVGFVLAGDKIGLARLRAKFGDRMAQTPEWPMFDFVTSQATVTSLEFRKVAQEVAGIDSLNSFLKSYSDLYGPDGALAPGKAAAKG